MDENTSRGTPSTTDLATWRNHYSHTSPVVVDTSGALDAVYDPTGSSRPTMVLFGPGAEILSIGNANSVTASDIEAVLPTAYP